MADNFLERRQEEYEKKKAEWIRRKERTATRPQRCKEKDDCREA